MMEISPDMPLPRLSSDLKLTKGNVTEDGTPTWRLYHPVSHQYFQIGWVEFEYLSRFSLCQTYENLKEKITAETTLEADDEIFQELILFLNQHGLLQDTAHLPLNKLNADDKSILSDLVHKYLFFTVPLIKPQKFLESTYPFVSLLFSKQVNYLTICLLLIGLVLTLGRIDEFFTTFFNMVSPEGAITLAVTFAIIKIFHELGHAYTAVKHGLTVPHMGIAFMVMYPVLYTETTSAWHLASRREKVEIGMAGIRVELMLAAIFLFIWNYSAPGLLQSISFSVVAISLLGSLLVNSNPLMRFDGYFILSDMLAIENLHSRSFACARWWLRKALFGWKDRCPEETASPKKIRFFILFGWATLIYRFFLFAGIAVLVYVLFPKPLGLILMIIEIMWFILRPVSSEVKIWISRSSELFAYARGKITGLFLALVILSLFIPLQGNISAPAVYHAEEYRDFYAPYPAQIKQVNLPPNDRVQEGDILIELQSAELERDYKLAELALENLKKIQRRQQTSSALVRLDSGRLKAEIENLEIKLASFNQKKEQLIIKAPYTGIIKDQNSELSEGRYITEQDLLFRVISPERSLITAYVTENALDRLEMGVDGVFRPNYAVFHTIPVMLKEIERTNISDLDKRALSSVFGGPIYSELFKSRDGSPKIVPRQSLYKVLLEPRKTEAFIAMPGQVKIAAERVTAISLISGWLYSILLPESDIIG